MGVNRTNQRILDLIRIATVIIALSTTKTSSSSDVLREIGNVWVIFGRVADSDEKMLSVLADLGELMQEVVSITKNCARRSRELMA